jgi:hypothetical protein
VQSWRHLRQGGGPTRLPRRTISELARRRSEFASTLRHQGFDSLILMLKRGARAQLMSRGTAYHRTGNDIGPKSNCGLHRLIVRMRCLVAVGVLR